jgi:hypothetical protein
MAKRRQAADEKLNRANGTDVQTIFDTKMEAIRNFHIITPLRENMQDIPTGGNHYPLPFLPTRPGAIAPPNNTNKGFHYLDTPIFYNTLELTSLVTES